MPKSLRITLLLVGIIIVLCSFAALAYSFWPQGSLSDQVQLAPTLFTPP